ncbi:MAG TPA: glycine cleavage system protein GcvH [Cyclobacteriaceae bacterium]|nr:glycine cleavage system protein GcvH [Cyclobacteriaceae bacterium]HRE65700.1 glycine cleavage system protein GcvH [Cyclobacteriaceae bacterium]HRF32471.1 glycine cleavage system protein GcvH [Cyclobacteriaceae bacterium]
MNFPENIKYSKEHTWVSIEGNIGTIGITEFAQSELGEIVYVDMPRVGQSFKKDEVFGSVEAVKTTSDLIIPVSGIVKEINSNVVKDPSPVNSDSYKDGWLIKIEISDLNEVTGLLSSSGYKDLTGN